MKRQNIKKLLIRSVPYLLFALLGTKLGQAARLALHHTTLSTTECISCIRRVEQCSSMP